MSALVLKVHPSDNVIVALQDLHNGQKVTYDGVEYQIKGSVPAKHKFVTEDIALGAPIYMYGVLVGKATQPIASGEAIHTGNLKHASQPYQGKTKDISWQGPDISKYSNKTFMGYHRADGRVGTANYWLFVPTVFCENRNLDFIKEALEKELGYSKTDKYLQFTRQLVQQVKLGTMPSFESLSYANGSAAKDRVFPNIDGIKFLTHQMGCGGTRQDSGALAGLLAGYITHPNVAGVTILSLGCQHMQTADLVAEVNKRDQHFSKPMLIFEQQESQSEEWLITKAITDTMEQLIKVNEQTRKPAPLSKLSLGVKCGGSDGFSGISANPAVGYTADLLVALGGTVILAEFPELNGVEQELADRCVTPALADKFVNLMKTYSAQAVAAGSGFDANPSPGNIKDGLITDAIKSAGAAKKGGTSPITDVLDYTEPATKPGLNLLCTPGNDVEATTGKAGSGANLILFTTGLGTPTGNPVCPVIKVSTNHALTERMGDIIDIDTGGVITGKETIESMGEKILDYCIAVANGEISPKAVELGQDDFIPWKRGVSL